LKKKLFYFYQLNKNAYCTIKLVPVAMSVADFPAQWKQFLRTRAPWDGSVCAVCGSPLCAREPCWEHDAQYVHVTCVASRAHCLANPAQFTFHRGLTSEDMAASQKHLAQSLGLRYRLVLHCKPLGEMLCDQEYSLEIE
jgi:hypothetical protein